MSLLKSRFVYLLHLYECSKEATAAANLGRPVRRFANILNFTARKRLFTRKLCRLLLIRGGCLSKFTPSSDCAVLREMAKPRKSYSSGLSSPSMLNVKVHGSTVGKSLMASGLFERRNTLSNKRTWQHSLSWFWINYKTSGTMSSGDVCP